MSSPADTVGAQLAFFSPPAPEQAGKPKAAPAEEGFASRLFGADGFNLLDILDIINPLQHIPFVSSLYRKLTGDAIAPVSRVAGGALFGGPIGAAVSLVNTVIAEWSGKDVGDHVIALITDDGPDGDEPRIAGELPATDPGAAPAPPVASNTPVTAPDGAARDAESVARARHLSALLTLAAQTDDPGPSSHAGAAAPGGWYSDVMLAALAKYEQSAELARAAPQSVIDVAY